MKITTCSTSPRRPGRTGAASAPRSPEAQERPATAPPAASPSLTSSRRVRWRSIVLRIRPHRRAIARRMATIAGAVGRGNLSRARAATRAIVLAVATAARAKEQQTDQATKVPPGAKWSQAYIPSSGGVMLHADILRPAKLPANAKTPVILSIGPYFNHSGQTGPAGPVESTPFDPTASPGPSTRFYDFETGGDLFKKGYSYVMVDLRDFGGSSGCLDWVGPGEQSDVKHAVEWAAKQKWSTGKVGMYGKSYDGVTGLVAEDLSPTGLKAVVAGEPVY